MKKLIQDNAGFQLYAELKPIAALDNKQYELKFTTIWKESKNPDKEMVKAQFILSEEALDTLFKLMGTS